jgi:hypothetical protein
MSNFKDIKGELKRNRGKAATLGACAVMAMWSWSGILFGEESSIPTATPSQAQVATSTPSAKPVVVAASAAAIIAENTIHSYEMAKDRLKIWRGPLGLHMANFGSRPISTPNLLKTDENGEKGQFFGEKPGSKPPRLSGTVLFENSNYALFEETRVKEGEYIGRYFLEQVRSREVDLLDGSHRLTLRINPAAVVNSSSVK